MYIITNIDCSQIVYFSNDFEDIWYYYNTFLKNKKNYYVYRLDFSTSNILIVYD